MGYVDYYRQWSYIERCEARDRGEAEAVRQWDRDSESSERAWAQWSDGREYSDPDPKGRFH